MKKIGIIGAGISGLALAKLFKNKFQIEVLEKTDKIGGIAKTKDVDGVAYHMIGGHCFNSKNKKVLEFIFQNILPESQWHRIVRNAKISLDNILIPYPIEFAMKEIYVSNPKLALEFIEDFLSSKPQGEIKNLEEWFIHNFGKSMAEKYFIPYNKKIWNMDPKNMSPLWVEGKLPLPNKREFLKSLLESSTDSMPHSTFYYPNTNSQNTFIEALARGTEIIFNYKVSKIERIGEKWRVNNEREYDILVSTMPLNILPKILKDVPLEIIQSSELLKYNQVTTMLWHTKKVEQTWTYFPSQDTIFHRHIHIGNFFLPKKNYTITESIGFHSYEEMVENGKKHEYLIEPLDYNVSEHAYVVYDNNYKKATDKIKSYLRDKELFFLGRFGEWEYYNMDICIEKAQELAQFIEKGSE